MLWFGPLAAVSPPAPSELLTVDSNWRAHIETAMVLSGTSSGGLTVKIQGSENGARKPSLPHRSSGILEAFCVVFASACLFWVAVRMASLSMPILKTIACFKLFAGHKLIVLQPHFSSTLLHDADMTVRTFKNNITEGL